MMNVLFSIAFFVIPLLLAVKFCGWQVVAAFVITIILVPLFIIFLSELVEAHLQNRAFDFKKCYQLGAIFAIAGFPIYFIFILPLYYLMRSINFPFYISFPCCVSAVVLAFCLLIAEKPLSYLHYLIIIGCSLLHSLLIIWLIEKFKSFSA